jgi:hypothetical protein
MVGWKEEGGKRVQQPFYFGDDLDQAKARYLRVKELWTHLERAHERSLQELNSRFELPERTECRWTTESLWIARELAAGRVQVLVPRHPSIHPEAYLQRISGLGKMFPMVHFVPEDEEAFREGQAFWQKAIESRQNDLPLPLTNVGPQSPDRFHEALDRYVEHIRKTELERTSEELRLTAFGNLKAEQAERIKGRQPDRSLSALDFHGCQDLLDYWRNRPPTQPRHGKPSRPMAKKTCENHVAELMRFFRWLHKSKLFAWRKPEDFDDLATKIKDTTEERTGIGFLNVRVFSNDELALLNKYATPLERVLLLLGLNCGFKGAEQGTLRFEHLFLDRPHPVAPMLKEVARWEVGPEDRFILYSRNKSGVYGEFLLWPQTVAGLRWAAARQKRICSRLKIEAPQLLLNDKGIPFFRRTGSNKNQSQIFMNKWAGLIRRIRKDHPDFPGYSFSSLRDTASDRIRHIAGGEVAAVFLCHGEPVKKDNLLDLYTNRPFGEVFKALRRLEEDLKPVFDAAPSDPWETPMQQYTSLGTRQKILELHGQGMKVPEIVKALGTSPATIYRLLGRRHVRQQPENDRR